MGTHWIALYVNDDTVAYFDSFGVEYIPKEIKKFIGTKNIKANIYRIQVDDSIMRGYFCIGFIGFMPNSKGLLDYGNLFSPNEYEKNDKILLKYFKVKMKRIYCIKCDKYRKFKNPKISCIFDKTVVLYIVWDKCGNNDEKRYKE